MRCGRSSRTNRCRAPRSSTWWSSSAPPRAGSSCGGRRGATRDWPTSSGHDMKLGLIAGNGRFPFLVLDAARRAGHDVTVIALKEETFPDLAEVASRPPPAAFHWISIGELGQCISLLKAARVSQAVMAGQVKHTKLFNVRPDWTLGRVLMRLATRNTDSLISGVADVLGDEGIDLIDSTALLAPLLARAGVLTRRAPTDEEQS